MCELFFLPIRSSLYTHFLSLRKSKITHRFWAFAQFIRAMCPALHNAKWIQVSTKKKKIYSTSLWSSHTKIRGNCLKPFSCFCPFNNAVTGGTWYLSSCSDVLMQKGTNPRPSSLTPALQLFKLGGRLSVVCHCYFDSYAQSRQSTKLSLQSSELGITHSLTRRRVRVCTPSPLLVSGGHSRLGEKGWGVPIPTRSQRLSYSRYMYFVVVLLDISVRYRCQGREGEGVGAK